jgi:putative PIN family toxin of toxin-antitoxin system
MTTAAAAKLRVVLDTNVYFPAFTHKGLPFWIWQQAVLGCFVLLSSPPLLRELGEVLRLKAGWGEAEVVAQLKLLVKVAEIISPSVAVKAIADDDDDNRVLECAVAGEADLIVSSDYHLLKLRSFESIGIVHPLDFRRTLGG